MKVDLDKYKYKRIACFDYGLKRIGFAVSDELHITVRPVKVFDATDKDLYEQIIEELKSQNVGLIVVGQPVDYNGGSSKVLEAIDNFKDKLLVFTKLDVFLYDENYSSKEALQVMLASGKKKKDRRKKGNIDMTAAAVILKNFIREND
jgi:putative Holliday junction resolvase